MELAHMGSLFNVLQNPSFNPSWENTFEFAIEAAEGMQVLHALQPPLLHRDLKTLNLMVTNQMKIKVGDFGLSIFDNMNKPDGSMTGTAAYLAPEILEGAPFTIKADVFAFAVVFWELVNTTLKQAYQAPYEEYNLVLDMQILFAVATRDLRPSLPSNCPPEVLSFFTKCWSKVPEERPDFPSLVSQLKDLQTIFKERKRTWDASIGSNRLPNSDVSSSSSSPSISPSLSPAASPAVSPSSASIPSTPPFSSSSSSSSSSSRSGSFVGRTESRGTLSSKSDNGTRGGSISMHRNNRKSENSKISGELKLTSDRERSNSKDGK